MLALLCAACAGDRELPARGRADSVVVKPDTTSRATSVNQPAVFYVEATQAEIMAAKKGASEEDFAVIADDLMFYRSSAKELLEAWRIPFTRISGRRPMQFTIKGVPKNIDFSDTMLLDFVVVYRANEEPRVFAPNEIDQARAYWQSEATARDSVK